jgi:PTS system mannose-specific IIA component
MKKKIIKALLVTHGNLGNELIKVAEKIFETKIDISSINVEWKNMNDEVLNKVKHFLRINKKNDVIIFTDMFGGSPSNICFQFIGKKVEVITGVNLPAIIKYYTYRDKNLTLNELVKLIYKDAVNGINIISDYLGEKKND